MSFLKKYRDRCAFYCYLFICRIGIKGINKILYLSFACEVIKKTDIAKPNR